MTSAAHSQSTASTLRRLLLAILILGMLGMSTELVIIGHTEDPWQWTPLVLMLLSLNVLGWYALSRGAASIRVLRIVMVLFIASGFVGITLHMKAKIEFQQESNPSLAGMALYRTALQSQSPPALAPGMMIQLGLLGLAYTFHHPALGNPQENPANE